MPDALQLLKTRRSAKPREMNGPGPSPAELETILTIGARVPDHGKIAPWRFIVFEGDARRKAGDIIAKVFAAKNPGATIEQIEAEKKSPGRGTAGRLPWCPPPSRIPKVPPWEQELSAGASAMNIVTAANALGYVANWLTGWLRLRSRACSPHSACAPTRSSRASSISAASTSRSRIVPGRTSATLVTRF